MTAPDVKQESDLLKAFREVWEEGNGAWNAGDFGRAYATLPDDFTYDLAPTWPQARALRGRDEVVAFFKDFRETFPDVHSGPRLDLFEVGEGTMVVGFEVTGTGGRSGVSTTMEIWQVWEISPNLRPIRVREFASRAAALAAAGIAGEGSRSG